MDWRKGGKWAALALLLVPAGCAGGSTGSAEMRYTGTLPGCGLGASTLVRRYGDFSFAPGDGALTIQGTVAADGSYSGTLDTQPKDKPAYVLGVQGKIADETATVVYVTPRCRAEGTFKREHYSLL